MRARLMPLALTALVAAGPLVGHETTLEPLDGSYIQTFEVDEATARLLTAANVTGLGVAVLTRGKIS